MCCKILAISSSSDFLLPHESNIITLLATFVPKPRVGYQCIHSPQQVLSCRGLGCECVGWQRSRSAGSYLGFRRLCLPLELCLLRLFATKTLNGGKDHEKQLKPLRAWKLPSLHFLPKAPLRRHTVLVFPGFWCRSSENKAHLGFFYIYRAKKENKKQYIWVTPWSISSDRWPEIGIRTAGVYGLVFSPTLTVLACLGFFFLLQSHWSL